MANRFVPAQDAGALAAEALATAAGSLRIGLLCSPMLRGVPRHYEYGNVQNEPKPPESPRPPEWMLQNVPKCSSFEFFGDSAAVWAGLLGSRATKCYQALPFSILESGFHHRDTEISSKTIPVMKLESASAEF